MDRIVNRGHPRRDRQGAFRKHGAGLSRRGGRIIVRAMAWWSVRGMMTQAGRI